MQGLGSSNLSLCFSYELHVVQCGLTLRMVRRDSNVFSRRYISAIRKYMPGILPPPPLFIPFSNILYRLGISKHVRVRPQQAAPHVTQTLVVGGAQNPRRVHRAIPHPHM
jgi:hypothetical protein